MRLLPPRDVHRLRRPQLRPVGHPRPRGPGGARGGRVARPRRRSGPAALLLLLWHLPPLPGGQPAAQLQVRQVQEDLLEPGLPHRDEVPVVRAHGECYYLKTDK